MITKQLHTERQKYHHHWFPSLTSIKCMYLLPLKKKIKNKTRPRKKEENTCMWIIYTTVYHVARLSGPSMIARLLLKLSQTKTGSSNRLPARKVSRGDNLFPLFPAATVLESRLIAIRRPQHHNQIHTDI